MPMRVSEESHRRSVKMAELKVLINDYQREHDLSTWEVIHALAGWIETAMKYVIRADRKEEETSDAGGS